MFIDFPDEARMERSQDGSEPIRGGSIGLNTILGMFVARAKTDKVPAWTMFAINGETVFRNVWKSGMGLTELVPAWEADIRLFIRYLQSYLSYVYKGDQPPKPIPVVIYLPDYKRVPMALRRAHTGQQLEQDNLYSKFLGTYRGKPDNIDRNAYIDHWLLTVGFQTYPHVELHRWIDTYTRTAVSAYSTQTQLAMISHVPLDLHMVGRRPRMQVIESYTGRILSPQDFRFKLDKEGRLPFITVTHLVFGDKLMIQPMVKPAFRKRLLEQAVAQKWLIRSPSYILNQITAATNLPGSLIKGVNFV